MAWVRIDDQAPRNEKFLVAGPSASWLWVCGLAHCQAQLTDGFVSEAVLPMIGVPKGYKELARALVRAGLWEAAERGYRVHDYFDFNPSRADVLLKRAEDSKRKRPKYSARNPDWNPSGSKADSTAPRAGVPSHPIPSKEDAGASSAAPAAVPERRRSGDRRSNRPIFVGQRITIFEWMFDEITKILGPFADDFGLDTWFHEADQLAMQRRVVGREWWPFVESALLAEAARRGLSVVSGDGLKVAAPAKVHGCAHQPPCGDAAAHTQRDLADRRRIPA